MLKIITILYRYLPSFPYQDNPILHLYAGLICFHLADHLDNEGGKESLLAQAKGHLDRSLALKSDDVTANAFVGEVRAVQVKQTVMIYLAVQIESLLECTRNGPLQNLMDERASHEDMDLDAARDGAPTKRQRFADSST